MTDAGEILKSGAGEKIADLVNKLAGPCPLKPKQLEWTPPPPTKFRLHRIS